MNVNSPHGPAASASESAGDTATAIGSPVFAVFILRTPSRTRVRAPDTNGVAPAQACLPQDLERHALPRPERPAGRRNAPRPPPSTRRSLQSLAWRLSLQPSGLQRLGRNLPATGTVRAGLRQSVWLRQAWRLACRARLRCLRASMRRLASRRASARSWRRCSRAGAGQQTTGRPCLALAVHVERPSERAGGRALVALGAGPERHIVSGEEFGRAVFAGQAHARAVALTDIPDGLSVPGYLAVQMRRKLMGHCLSGSRLTFESRGGFLADSRRASLRHAPWDFHFRHARRP